LSSNGAISERLVVLLEGRVFAIEDVLWIGRMSEVDEAIKAREKSALIFNVEKDISSCHTQRIERIGFIA